MGGCSANHIEEIEASQLARDHFACFVRKDAQLPAGFDNPRLAQAPLQVDDLDRFEMARKASDRLNGKLARVPHIEAKFPDMSLPVGPLSNASGSLIYLGSVKDNLPHGWGEALTSEGIFYTGYFEDGIPNYFGRMKAVDGSIYEGGLYRFSRDGYGKLSLPNGAVQEGEWKFGRLFCSSKTSHRRPQSKEDLLPDQSRQSIDSALGMSIQPIGDFSPPMDSRCMSPLAIKPSSKTFVMGSECGKQFVDTKPPVRSCFKKLTGERKTSDRHISFVIPDMSRN